jgi:hypothetical protein
MEVPAESTTVARAKLRNKKRARMPVDGRSALGLRIKALRLAFRARVAGDVDDDPLLLAAVETAARLTALAEHAAARALRADPKVALDDVVRLSRLADIAVRRLRLDQRTAPATPTLSTYLASRTEQQP